MIFVLTGPVHSGKTTLLKKAVALWTNKGFRVGGFLSEARSKGGKVIGYDLVDLKKGAVIPFLSKEGSSEWPTSGPFFFRPQGLKKAEAVMARDRGDDLLVVDEVGPLEMQGGGFWPALEKVVAMEAACLCVVREGLLEKFRTRTGLKKIKIFHRESRGVINLMTKAIFGRRGRQAGPPTEKTDMAVELKFFAYFRDLFGSSAKNVTLPRGSTLGRLLAVICDTPKRRAEVFDGVSVKSQVIVMKNGSPVDSRTALGTPIEEGDRIAIFPFVGGG